MGGKLGRRVSLGVDEGMKVREQVGKGLTLSWGPCWGLAARELGKEICLPRLSKNKILCGM